MNVLRVSFEFWILEFIWDLVLGIWCLPYDIHSDNQFDQDLWIIDRCQPPQPGG